MNFPIPDPSINIIQEEAPPISLKIVVSPQQNIRFTEGRVFGLECDAAADVTGEIKFSWTKNGHFLTTGDRIIRESRRNGNIMILRPLPSDVGQYQCWAKNSEGAVGSRVVMVTQAMAFSSRLRTSVRSEGASRRPRIIVYPAQRLKEVQPITIVEPLHIVEAVGS